MKRVLFLALLLALVATPVFASDISDALYEADVAVVNTGAATTNVCVPFSLSTASLIDNGFIEADCTDTCMQISGTDVAYMPAPGDTSNWILFVPTIGTTTLTSNLYLGGGTDMDAKLRYFPAAAGMSATGAANMAWQNNGAIEIKGYFDLSTPGANVYFLYADDGANNYIKIRVSNVNEITSMIVSGGGVFSVTSVAPGLTSGEHTLKVELTGGNQTIYWDTVQQDQDAFAAAINVFNFTWYYIQNGCMNYMEYMKMWTGGTLRQQIEWNYDAAAPYQFTDLSGSGNHCVPTFRTTSSDVDVSASMSGMSPISESEAEGYDLTGGVELITDIPDAIPNMYDEGETGGMIIAGPIVEAAVVADVPVAFILYPIAFATAIGLGFLAFGWTKSLIVQSVVSAIVMAAFCGGGVLGDGLIPYWTVVVFIIEAVFMIIVHERQHA